MPPPVTGKQRAARIPLDYFKHPTFLDWGRGWWALADRRARGSGLGGVRLADERPGPDLLLARAGDGRSCDMGPRLHGLPYGFHAVERRRLCQAFRLDAHAMNQKCEACHKGPPHHAEATPELACAACHHDHRGRDASLVRLADSDCTRCHADLTNHMAREADRGRQGHGLHGCSTSRVRRVEGQRQRPRQSQVQPCRRHMQADLKARTAVLAIISTLAMRRSSAAN